MAYFVFCSLRPVRVCVCVYLCVQGGGVPSLRVFFGGWYGYSWLLGRRPYSGPERTGHELHVMRSVHFKSCELFFTWILGHP